MSAISNSLPKMWKYWYKFNCNGIEFKILATDQKDAESKIKAITVNKCKCLGIDEDN